MPSPTQSPVIPSWSSPATFGPRSRPFAVAGIKRTCGRCCSSTWRSAAVQSGGSYSLSRPSSTITTRSAPRRARSVATSVPQTSATLSPPRFPDRPRRAEDAGPHLGLHDARQVRPVEEGGGLGGHLPRLGVRRLPPADDEVDAAFLLNREGERARRAERVGYGEDAVG